MVFLLLDAGWVDVDPAAVFLNGGGFFFFIFYFSEKNYG